MDKKKYAYIDKQYGRLHIADAASALPQAKNAKLIETDFPATQGKPLKSGEPKMLDSGLGIDYSDCTYYDIKSLEDAEGTGNTALIELFKQLM